MKSLPEKKKKYKKENLKNDNANTFSREKISYFRYYTVLLVPQFWVLFFIVERVPSSYKIPFVGGGGPIGPKSATFVDGLLAKYFSNFAIICLPYVYLRNDAKCGRIFVINILRWLDSQTSNIFCTT